MCVCSHSVYITCKLGCIHLYVCLSVYHSVCLSVCLSVYLHSSRDGRPLTDDEIAGLLIGFLLAGQHTSSTTSSWMGFFLAHNKHLQDSLYKEQIKVCGEDLPPLKFDQVCSPSSSAPSFSFASSSPSFPSSPPYILVSLNHSNPQLHVSPFYPCLCSSACVCVYSNTFPVFSLLIHNN